MNKRKYIIRFAKISCVIITIGILLCVIGSLVAIPIFVSQHVNYKGYASKKYPMQDIYEASDFDLNESQMYLTTEDGLSIWTSEIYIEQPKAVVIYLTGIVQPSITYFYGHAKYMQENGFASFLLEVRGHGNSDGNRICLGYNEVNDVKAVVDYIKSNPKYEGIPIILHGVSMGGAVAINSFGQLKDVDGLIAMSAYSSFEDVVIDIMNNIGIPKIIQKLERPILSTSLKLMFGSNSVNNMKPLEQIKNAGDRPVLLIACTKDTEVPMDSMLRLKEANPDVDTWLRDSWEHFIVKDCDFKNMSKDTEYCDRILTFLNKFNR